MRRTTDGAPASRRSPRLTPATLLLAAVGLLAADWGYRRVGDSLIAGGLLDETAHLLTALLVLWAIGRSACERFMTPTLIASVAIDIDHVPARLGLQWLTAGTPRPYTHSLLTIALLLAAAVLWRRRRWVTLGLALGVSLHFFRDLAESGTGVSLLWPWSDHAFTLPHGGYLATMAAVVLIDAARCAPWRRPLHGSQASIRMKPNAIPGRIEPDVGERREKQMPAASLNSASALPPGREPQSQPADLAIRSPSG